MRDGPKVKYKYQFREYPKMVYAGNQCTTVNNEAMERALGWLPGGGDVKSPVVLTYKQALEAQKALDARKVKYTRKASPEE